MLRKQLMVVMKIILMEKLRLISCLWCICLKTMQSSNKKPTRKSLDSLRKRMRSTSVDRIRFLFHKTWSLKRKHLVKERTVWARKREIISLGSWTWLWIQLMVRKDARLDARIRKHVWMMGLLASSYQALAPTSIHSILMSHCPISTSVGFRTTTGLFLNRTWVPSLITLRPSFQW